MDKWFENRLKVVKVESAGHWVHWDQAERVTQEILSWLEEVVEENRKP